MAHDVSKVKNDGFTRYMNNQAYKDCKTEFIAKLNNQPNQLVYNTKGSWPITGRNLIKGCQCDFSHDLIMV